MMQKKQPKIAMATNCAMFEVMFIFYLMFIIHKSLTGSMHSGARGYLPVALTGFLFPWKYF